MSIITRYQLGCGIEAQILGPGGDDNRGVVVQFLFPGMRPGIYRKFDTYISEVNFLHFQNAVLDVLYPNDNPPASNTEAVLNDVGVAK